MKLREIILPEVLEAFQIVEFMADNTTWTQPEDVVAALGIEKSRVDALYTGLLQGEIVFGTPETGYKLSLTLYRLGQTVLRQSIKENIRREMMCTVNKVVLESNETSFFGVMTDRNDPMYVTKQNPSQNGVEGRDMGKRIPLQTSAIGKSLLAWRDEKAVRKLIAKNPVSVFSERAILDPDAFIEHLKTVRVHGFSLNNCETPEGLVCVAAPIFEKGKRYPVAGVSIVSTPEKMYSHFFHKAGECVHAAAKAMSENLGATTYPKYKQMPIPSH